MILVIEIGAIMEEHSIGMEDDKIKCLVYVVVFI